MFRIFLFFLLAGGIMTAIAPTADAQRRDYLTDEELDIVRDAQEIDQRVAVLMHIADRRFTALGAEPVADGQKKEKKGSDKWGAAPAGSRLELLDDVRRIIQKAIDDIDNLSERPDSMVVDEPEKGKKPIKYEDVFPKAVHILAGAAKRFQPMLKQQLDISKDEREKGTILQSLDFCSQIIDAESKLPAPSSKKAGT